MFPCRYTPAGEKCVSGTASVLEDPLAKSQHRLGILDVLEPFGFHRGCRGKLVRHQHLPKYDMEELKRSGWFELYQQYQGRAVFEKTDRLVSFIGAKGRWARFVGVYDILERLPASRGPMPRDCPHPEWKKTSSTFYRMRRDPAFADLEDRLFIDWGGSTRAWYQKLRNKPVMEIVPPGQVLPPFEDYLEFSLTHVELAAIFASPEAHREWKARLSAVAGIYLIVAGTSGAQYVGSAYGETGIWGRWRQYAKNGHGGNKLLRKLCETSKSYPARFNYSVLQVLPKTFTRAEVLGWEVRYKNKLGRKAVSLNMN